VETEKGGKLKRGRRKRNERTEREGRREIVKRDSDGGDGEAVKS
jgi:hypothetical protein